MSERQPIESAMRSDPKRCLNGHDLVEHGVRRKGRHDLQCLLCERARTQRARDRKKAQS